MVKMKLAASYVLSIVALVSAFTGDDKFLRKYAMMKVYESCFGPEVVKEVRMEMKAAASKCAGISSTAASTHHPSVIKHSSSQMHKVHSQIHDVKDKHHHQSGSHHGMSNALTSHHQESLPHTAALTAAATVADQQVPSKHPTLDLSKLQEAIISGYNKPYTSPQSQSYPAQPQVHHHQSYLQPYQMGYSNRPYYQQPPPPYYPQHSLYQSQPYVPNPAYYPQPYHPYQPSYFTGRSSRDLDVRGQLETLTNRMSGRIRNVTCVMQELGYLDNHLEPDYGRMIDRIGRLPVAEDLKKDMVEGVDFCRQFSQCVPDDKKDKLIREMVRPMFFFRCYKHKKLEACIMKDVRERYTNSDDITEDNLALNDHRSAKEFPEDNMATAIYEFLYGEDNIDIDTLL